MDYLLRRGEYAEPSTSPVPGLILLDLNMPRKDGREALAEIKENPELRRIPIVVMTSSRVGADILNAYDLGISGYVQKPMTLEQLLDILKTIGHYYLQIVQLPPSGATQ